MKENNKVKFYFGPLDGLELVVGEKISNDLSQDDIFKTAVEYTRFTEKESGQDLMNNDILPLFHIKTIEKMGWLKDE